MQENLDDLSLEEFVALARLAGHALSTSQAKPMQAAYRKLRAQAALVHRHREPDTEPALIFQVARHAS